MNQNAINAINYLLASMYNEMYRNKDSNIVRLYCVATLISTYAGHIEF